MTERSEGPGCRDVARSTVLLLGFAVVFIAAGLNLANLTVCTGICETFGLTLLYAGGPISAALGVFFGWVLVAWPLEATLWVVAGFISARWAENHERGVLGLVFIILVAALIYGLVLAQLVEIAI